MVRQPLPAEMLEQLPAALAQAALRLLAIADQASERTPGAHLRPPISTSCTCCMTYTPVCACMARTEYMPENARSTAVAMPADRLATLTGMLPQHRCVDVHTEHEARVAWRLQHPQRGDYMRRHAYDAQLRARRPRRRQRTAPPPQPGNACGNSSGAQGTQQSQHQACSVRQATSSFRARGHALFRSIERAEAATNSKPRDVFNRSRRRRPVDSAKAIRGTSMATCDRLVQSAGGHLMWSTGAEWHTSAPRQRLGHRPDSAMAVTCGQRCMSAPVQDNLRRPASVDPGLGSMMRHRHGMKQGKSGRQNHSNYRSRHTAAARCQSMDDDRRKHHEQLRKSAERVDTVQALAREVDRQTRWLWFEHSMLQRAKLAV